MTTTEVAEAAPGFASLHPGYALTANDKGGHEARLSLAPLGQLIRALHAVAVRARRIGVAPIIAGAIDRAGDDIRRTHIIIVIGLAVVIGIAERVSRCHADKCAGGYPRRNRRTATTRKAW